LFSPGEGGTDIISASERRAALEADHPKWVPRTIAQALDVAAGRYPERPLVLTDDHEYSYREIEESSRRIAAALIELGVKPGDHVAMVVANYPEFVTVKFGIARAGATAIPVNYLFRSAELKYVLDQSEAVALVTMDRFRNLDYIETLNEIAPGWEERGGGEQIPLLRDVIVFSPTGGYDGKARTLDSLAATDPAAFADELDRRAREADPFGHSDILYTSGTTGAPKGVLMTHEMVLRTAYGATYNRALPDGHRMLFALPMYHVFGYIECLLASLFVGGAIAPLVVFDPADMLREIDRLQANEIICVPTMTLALLAEARRGDYDLGSLRVVFSSGGVQPESIWRDIRETLAPEEVTTGYGMTETTAATACTLPEGPDEWLVKSNGRLRDAGVAGDPELDGKLAVYKAIDLQTGEDLQPGERGELLVRGPIVTPGYFNKPEETAAAFTADGWLRTGDIGTIDAEGYVRLTGRLKESYRCGGEMVMPKEVELVLDAHPAVAQSHVIGVPDERMGEVGCAWVVVAPGVATSEGELIEYCRERLARFKVPRYVIFTAAADLPVTATGRVQKFELVEMAKERLLQPQMTGEV
jgi:fatty-acyl-CoA synthase